jgi:hypothetical protein
LFLQPVLDKLTDLVDKSVFMEKNSITIEADSIYNDVVNALRSSANMFIPKQEKKLLQILVVSKTRYLERPSNCLVKSLERCRQA